MVQVFSEYSGLDVEFIKAITAHKEWYENRCPLRVSFLVDYFAVFSLAKDIQHRMAKVLVNVELGRI